MKTVRDYKRFTGCKKGNMQHTSIGGSKIMGMAASQARFLALTARKSNVEFQGQQINQQRTTLANETSAYNEQLLTMTVPTAPSTDSFTKTTYNLSDKVGNSGTVSGISYNDDGTINLAYNYTTTGSQATTGSALFYSSTTTDANNNPVTNYYAGSGSNKTALTAINLANMDSEDASSLNLIYGSNYSAKDGSGNYKNAYYKYTSGSEERYVALADLQKYANSSTNMVYHYVNDNATITQTANIKNGTPNWTSSGRLSSVTTSDGGSSYTYSMNATTTTDTAAYTDAMNEYEYQKALYDQTLNQINAKLSVVQQQDKTLELKLKDVDTEQQALSTELDAVKKVTDKNVESTFKTFG